MLTGHVGVSSLLGMTASAAIVVVDMARERARDQVDGSLIRALMASLDDVTIRSFADMLGVEQRTVARWRAGKIDRLTWFGILHQLNLPIDWAPPPSDQEPT